MPVPISRSERPGVSTVDAVARALASVHLWAGCSAAPTSCRTEWLPTVVWYIGCSKFRVSYILDGEYQRKPSPKNAHQTVTSSRADHRRNISRHNRCTLSRQELGKADGSPDRY